MCDSPEFQTLLKLDLLKFLNRKLKYYQDQLVKNKQKLDLDFLNNFAWTAEQILIYTKVVKFLSTKLETWTVENIAEIDLQHTLDETFRLLQVYTLNAIDNADNSSSPGSRFANMADLKVYRILLEIISEALLFFKQGV